MGATPEDKEKRSKVVRAFITKTLDGKDKVVSESELEKYRIARKEDTEAESQQLQEKGMLEIYNSGGVVTPPYNLFYMWRFMELCTEHSSAVRQKASDVCGLGYKIVKRKGVVKANEKEKELLESFFEFGNPDETFTEVAVKFWTDEEAVGMAYFEVVTDDKGSPRALYHIPAHTMRCTKDPDIFIQIRGENKKIFRRYKKVTDAVAKRYVREKIQLAMFKNATTEIEKAKVANQWNIDEATSEVVCIKNYTSRSSFYGIPEWIPALGAILGNVECRDYNLKFFENNGVPHYAIIIKGADLDDELENVIATFFSQEIRGDAHKTLIIPINSQEVEVIFEKLSTDIKDASFRMYRQDNRDEIIRAHRVPFSRMNVSTPGKLGGAGTNEGESESYKKSVIAPKQVVFEHRINEILIRRGFGIQDWKLEFVKLDATDVETDMRINTAYVKGGVKSINEAREDCGLEPKEGGDRLFINTATGIIFLDEMGNMTSQSAVGTQANQEQNKVVAKAMGDLNITLKNLLDDRIEVRERTQGLVRKLVRKLTGK